MQIWEVVQIFLSDGDLQELIKTQKPKILLASNDTLSQKDIVFQDDLLLVLNKNPSQNVHPGDHKTKEVSLIEQVQDYLWEASKSLTFAPSLIHRIDRDTSGIVMVAKDKNTLSTLAADFKKKQEIQKTYFAIVLWKLSRKTGTITKKLRRIENAKNENKVQVSDSGQEAVSHYTLIDEYLLKLPEWEQYISCVEITIETGRMHQIRVHMAALGNPILGDKAYGNKKLNAYFAKHFSVSRQMLHAWKIGFVHPWKNEKMSLEAKLKKDMMSFIRELKN